MELPDRVRQARDGPDQLDHERLQAGSRWAGRPGRAQSAAPGGCVPCPAPAPGRARAARPRVRDRHQPLAQGRFERLLPAEVVEDGGQVDHRLQPVRAREPVRRDDPLGGQLAAGGPDGRRGRRCRARAGHRQLHPTPPPASPAPRPRARSNAVGLVRPHRRTHPAGLVASVPCASPHRNALRCQARGQRFLGREQPPHPDPPAFAAPVADVDPAGRGRNHPATGARNIQGEEKGRRLSLGGGPGVAPGQVDLQGDARARPRRAWLRG